MYHVFEYRQFSISIFSCICNKLGSNEDLIINLQGVEHFLSEYNPGDRSDTSHEANRINESILLLVILGKS